MLKILDRYLIREIVLPFVIALVVLTFVLEIPVILQYGEDLVARGVEWSIVLRVLLTLLPQALSLTIPMAVLLGILVGFGRLSGDREFVALQACGVSLGRLLAPVTLIAVVGTAATAYETIVALPDANQTFREIVYGVMASRVESNVKPRVFFDDFPNRVIYVRDLPQEGGWRDVLFAVAEAGRVTVYFAREGHVVLDRERRLVQLQLIDGTSHSTSLADPDSYESSGFETSSITLDPELVFPRPPAKGVREMTFAELQNGIDEAASRGETANDQRFFYQQKLSLPATCPILAFMALALGASNRKDGRLASFALGLGVIFIYYVLLWAARALALGGRLNPDWAPWIPNIIMGAVAIALLAWRARAADRPIRFTMPTLRRRPTVPPHLLRSVAPSWLRWPRVVVVIRVPRVNVPRPKLLDLYVSRSYLRVFALAVFALLGIFYISTFIDLADKLFRGEATTALMLRYFFFQTPQFVYFVIPIAVLVAVLVTVGLLTKNSELIVMRACGISLYRAVTPLLGFALLASAALYAMQEHVLASANREADRLNRIIRGWPPQASVGARQWVVGTNGDIYRFDYFDPATNRFSRLWAYHVDPKSWGLRGMSYAEEATALESAGPAGPTYEWQGQGGWLREFTTARDGRRNVKYTRFETSPLRLDPPGYFKVDTPDAEMMTYDQLRDYIAQLQSGGAYAARFVVSLQRKIAFPFVTVVMTMLAIPFAVSTGSRGALYGIGIGVLLAIAYWIALSLFAALGAGGVLGPVLAAWAPNILFGSVASYLILTVRT